MASGDADSATCKEKQFLQNFLTSVDTKPVKDKLKKAFMILQLKLPVFSSSKFIYTNAADDVSFSDAFCKRVTFDDNWAIASFFVTGTNVIGSYLFESKVPDSEEEVQILHRLIQYLTNNQDDHRTVVANLTPRGQGMTPCSIVLAHHLLSKLSRTDDFIIDNHTRKEPEGYPCHCGQNMLDRFGDTSIGSETVWHGCLDVVLETAGVSCVDLSEDTVENEEADPTVEVKTGGRKQSTVNRTLAQCVVFSFLQKKSHPRMKHFMIPCLGIDPHTCSVVIYMYDSEHDVMLDSGCIPLTEEENGQDFISFPAVLSIWMVVNYKCLGSGLTEIEPAKDPIPKADFFAMPQEKLNVYKTGLRLGNVVENRNSIGMRRGLDERCPYQPAKIRKMTESFYLK